MLSYTYDEYLQEWQAEHGDAEAGEFVYFIYGQEWSVQLQKMSHERFNNTVTFLHQLNVEYGSLLPTEQGEPMTPENERRAYTLLAKMFPLELALFC